MSKNIKEAISLTTYFISLPRSRYLVLGILLLGFIVGFVINIGRYSDFELIKNSILDGTLAITAPALISSLVVQILLRKMPYRRIAATALAGAIFYSIAYVSSFLLIPINPHWSELVLFMASALVFVLWYCIGRFVFIVKYRAILFAIIQLLLYLIFFANSRVFMLGNEPFFGVATKFYVSSFIFLALIALFMYIINAPMKKNFGFSSTDAISLLFSQWLYHNKDMEKAFDQVGENARTLVSSFSFKRKDGVYHFVIPYVHFGPFGNLGGSEFSYLLSKEIEDKYQAKSFVFHGSVTHDLNPVSSNELSKIVSAFDRSVRSAKFSKASASILQGSYSECRCECLKINESLFLGVSRAPLVTEDINFGLGLSLMAEAEKHSDIAMLADQHNAETGEITSFEPGSIIGYNYLHAIKNVFEQKESSKSPLKVGFSFKDVDSSSVGKAGIKVALLSTDPYYLIVLIDCNGVTPQFRERIIQECKSIGKELGIDLLPSVYTTDTHQLNMVRGVLNPLKDEDRMLSIIGSALKEAHSDLSEATFSSSKEWFDIKVIGAKQSIEAISTVNSIDRKSVV